MRTYTESDLSHWESIDISRLGIKKAKDFMTNLMLCLPKDGLISFEGDLSNINKPPIVLDIEKTQNIIRNTVAPRLDFWIFELNETSKKYLTNDFFNRVGLGIMSFIFQSSMILS